MTRFGNLLSLSSRTVPSELFDHFTLLLYRRGIRELAASL